MDKQFESFLDDLAGALKKAAECAVWDIPATHRTKDSISAYRASVSMVSHVVLAVLAKHRAPAVELKAPVVEPVVAVAVVEPIAPEPERLFDSDADKPRRRRNIGE